MNYYNQKQEVVEWQGKEGLGKHKLFTVPEESSKLVSDISFSFSSKLVWLKSLFKFLSSKCFPASGTKIYEKHNACKRRTITALQTTAQCCRKD